MKKTNFVLIVLTTILLSGCMEQTPSTLDTQPEFTLTFTTANTSTPIPTFTKQPTLIPSATWTPLPTLLSEEADTKIKELLDNNGNCELPCWWGITPNKTTWDEASHFLSQLAVQIEVGENKYIYINGTQHFVENFSFYYQIADIANPTQLFFYVQDGIVLDIIVFSPAAEYKYQLHQLLNLFGLPKQILINAQSSSPISELPPTILALDYSDIGVWALYGYTPIQVGDKLEICPASNLGRVSIYDNLGGRLRLFDPSMENEEEFSILEYADSVGGVNSLNLENATNMGIEIFYNTFIDPDNDICLETPSDLWP